MTHVPVPIQLSDGAQEPRYATPGAAGLDLQSMIDFELAPLERKSVPTGIRIAIPEGFEAQIRPRSGLALREGLSMVNSPGTIDCDFRGEIHVILINLGSSVVKVTSGERIGQMVLSPVARIEWQPVKSLTPTERAEGGFGSTGRK